MKTRKVKKLWLLEKITYNFMREIFIGGQRRKTIPSVREGVVWNYTNGFLYVARKDSTFDGSDCIKIEDVTRVFGRLDREECLTYSNSIIRKIGLDKKQWT